MAFHVKNQVTDETMTQQVETMMVYTAVVPASLLISIAKTTGRIPPKALEKWVSQSLSPSIEGSRKIRLR